MTRAFDRRRPLWPGLLLALLALLVLLPRAARGDEVVADLSSHLIAISSGFTGASVVLFGATDGPGDIVAVVRGPEREMTVWRKRQGSPASGSMPKSVTFGNVPSFYAIAASRPLDEIVPPNIAALYKHWPRQSEVRCPAGPLAGAQQAFSPTR